MRMRLLMTFGEEVNGLNNYRDTCKSCKGC